LSGSRCTDPDVRAALEVGPDESLLGFLSIGSIVEAPKLSSRPEIGEVVFDFDGARISPFNGDPG
jgi:hypothetical protein